MARTVMCKKYQRELAGLDAPPFPGPAGLEIYEHVSRDAWSEWLKLQTMLINEKRLNVREAQTRAYLSTQRDRFLNNEAHDHADGYVPPAEAE
jgi:Fe-S cluster biosynthesis and repair protein YggX